jgi:hypothetical protein
LLNYQTLLQDQSNENEIIPQKFPSNLLTQKDRNDNQNSMINEDEITQPKNLDRKQINHKTSESFPNSCKNLRT